MNAVESRRAARCANFENRSDPMPPLPLMTPVDAQQRASAELSAWTAGIGDPMPDYQPPAKNGFYLFGPPGVGKTYLAALTADTLRRHGVPVLFIRAKHALDHLRNFDHPKWVPDWRVYLSTVDVLILDDLGAHQATPYAIEELVDALGNRYDSRLPTLITSNLDGPELIGALGERVADRVMGLCQAIKVDGESLR